tara:strand:- start:1335 stop:1808 length:474 start_codon:yes stop_codon:yes gene_type:complete
VRADLLSIDSGFREFGWAAFFGGELVCAGLGINAGGPPRQPVNFADTFVPILERFEWNSAKAVIEFPKNRISTQNVDALLKLASSCGAFTSLLQAAGFEVEWVYPHEWKGMVPKHIMCKRILDKVTPSEYDVIDRPRNHNVLDAVGVGLWKSQRLRR